MVLKNGSMKRRPASLHWLRQGTVRQLHRYYRDAMTSCRPSRVTSLPSFGGTSASTRSVRSPTDECTAGAWSWSPGISIRNFAEETTGPPKFLENPNCPFAMAPFRLRQDCRHQTIAVQQHWPLVQDQQRLPRKVFRSSIAWLSDSLSTLRSARYHAPRKTRFRPLVRRYRAGFPPARSR